MRNTNLTKKNNEENEAPGFKKDKTRVTIAACCNADGSCKLPLVVIGKSAKPRKLKNQSKNTSYQKNCWMTAQLFKDWFKSEFVPQVTDFLKKSGLPARAVLLIDNCKAHLSLKVGEIETMFFPPKVTSIIQPLDQGILECLKIRYKNTLFTEIFNAQKNNDSDKEFTKTISQKETIDWISQYWNEIYSFTIYKCRNRLLTIDTREVATQTEND
ncbi:jerky protein homolog-like [Athalia rosae]|uniref:jerky protein homolog-like n=1 Tax=Athalia rosae TaxID=37344 RepID=UPI002033F254|nr:jerky protein homolog-like [Athalia rosae]